MFDLTGQVAMVTGGNGGLGLAMAKGLVKAGSAVAIWGRNAEKNEVALKSLQEMGADAAIFSCDVTDTDQVDAAFAATVKRFGKVDSCFANAGGGSSGMLHQTSEEEWNAAVDMNLTSVVNTYRPVIAHMLKRQQGGKLIVTSSAAAIMGMPMGSGYSATKAAVTGLTRALAIELGAAKIQVNALLPGYIETDMSLNTPQIFRDACKRRAAAGEVGKLEDMEGIAVYLASQQSNFMTGQSLVLDGGHSIHPL
ncbi:MAG: SDR family NAD(P)-dependent oxidoreductase [Parasphingorhabdus sp.]|uniref:SDR family NAD(P)-dependent oxidoreductase n=1 Tax=Parasphingorhabdus sp. TaxID=2709688 RepID=UPI00329A0C40